MFDYQRVIEPTGDRGNEHGTRLGYCEDSTYRRDQRGFGSLAMSWHFYNKRHEKPTKVESQTMKTVEQSVIHTTQT